MSFTEICLTITATVSVFLLCANIFLLLLLFSAKRKQKATQKATEKLLSVTAHDLRSPLTAIKGFADAILDGNIEQDKSCQYLAVISSEADRLAKISNRLCEGGKISLKKQIFGACECVRRAFLAVERKLAAKNLSVSFSFTDDDEFYACADADAVYEIVLNLFENAVKYASNDGFINWSINENDKFITLSIENSTDVLPDVQSLFAMGTTSGKSDEGSFGLGLYISKTLAEKMGATLSYQGKKEETTSCVFSLQLEKAKEL